MASNARILKELERYVLTDEQKERLLSMTDLERQIALDDIETQYEQQQRMMQLSGTAVVPGAIEEPEEGEIQMDLSGLKEKMDAAEVTVDMSAAEEQIRLEAAAKSADSIERYALGIMDIYPYAGVQSVLASNDAVPTLNTMNACKLTLTDLIAWHREWYFEEAVQGAVVGLNVPGNSSAQLAAFIVGVKNLEEPYSVTLPGSRSVTQSRRLLVVLCGTKLLGVQLNQVKFSPLDNAQYQVWLRLTTDSENSTPYIPTDAELIETAKTIDGLKNSSTETLRVLRQRVVAFRREIPIVTSNQVQLVIEQYQQLVKIATRKGEENLNRVEKAKMQRLAWLLDDMMADGSISLGNIDFDIGLNRHKSRLFVGRAAAEDDIDGHSEVSRFVLITAAQNPLSRRATSATSSKSVNAAAGPVTNYITTKPESLPNMDYSEYMGSLLNNMTSSE